MELAELKILYEELKEKPKTSGGFFDFGKKHDPLKEIDDEFLDSTIWDNPKRSAPLLKEKKQLQNQLKIEKKLESFHRGH